MADQPAKPRRHLPIIDDAWAHELDRQLDRSALHAHAAEINTLERVHDLAAWVFSAMELMMQKGLCTQAELREMNNRVKDSLKDRHWSKQVQLSLNGDPRDKYAQATNPVDCDARMHLCKGVCCYLEHALQVKDIQEGIVRWDHGRPYWIRKNAEGHCVHQERPSGRCGVFEARPLICRLYSCENDQRVWHDFAARIPNSEMIGKLMDGSFGDHLPEEPPPPRMIEDLPVIASSTPIDPEPR
ncbi:MAG: YkgJ family cysteine cluster protein [Deltaproteobacteria bacterium]|nr:YkgJ family cysteine cluster protein [Deltaproteobacteria bacterium]